MKVVAKCFSVINHGDDYQMFDVRKIQGHMTEDSIDGIKMLANILKWNGLLEAAQVSDLVLGLKWVLNASV